MCVVISYLARGYLQIEETNILKNHKDMNSRKLFKSSVLSPVIWITNKDLLYSTENSAQGYAPAWMVGRFGGQWIPVCVSLSPFAVHLKLPQHC